MLAGLLMCPPVFAQLTKGDSAKKVYYKTLATADSFYDADNYLSAAGYYEQVAAMAKIYNDTTTKGKVTTPLHYLAAVCWAKVGNKTKALENLALAIDLKEDDYQRFTFERDFESLRNEKEFIGLEKKFRSDMSDISPYYLWGALFGIMFMLFLYHLFLFISLREISFLYYSLFIFFWISLGITRTFEFGYFLKNTPLGWVLKVHPASGNHIFTPSLASVFYFLFVSSFLEIKKTSVRLNKIMRMFIILFALITILSCFFGFFSLFVVFPLFIIAYLFCFGVGISFWRKGYKSAKFFVMANIFFVTGLIWTILPYLKVTVPDHIGIFYPDNIGGVLFFLMLSFALGDKINLLKKDKIEAQEKALEVLEDKVQQRTAEVVKQKQVLEEKQKEILDSIQYAKRIQQSLLPTEKYIERNLNRLKKN